jgi:hypothetical protein
MATVLVESVKGDSIPLKTAVVAAGANNRSWQELIGESITTQSPFGKNNLCKKFIIDACAFVVLLWQLQRQLTTIPLPLLTLAQNRVQHRIRAIGGASRDAMALWLGAADGRPEGHLANLTRS